MLTIEAVDVGDVAKGTNPLVHSEQIEVGRAEEESRRLVAIEVPTDIGDSTELGLVFWGH